MHAAAQKIARALISHSPFHRCTRKISRFARNDDAGKALLSFSACLRRFSLSLSYHQCPIRPFGAPSPRGEGFGCGAAVFSFRRLLHGGKDLGLLPPSSGRRCPEGAEVGSRSGMRRKVRQPILSFRHPDRSPRFPCHSGVRHSCGSTENRLGTWVSPHPTLSVSSVCKEDFSLRSKWRYGKSGTLISHLFETLFPLAFIPPVPYPPIRGTFPSMGRLFMTSGKAPPSFLIQESFNRKAWTTTPMVSYYFFSQYATSVSAAPMPRAVLIPMPVYMAKEARVAARLAAMSFLKKP